ncbi:MAG: HD domain-containing protein [Candidatus Verstraetearchaeota archaeon]|nr:HD domain-containing protein [Candidatus Verstraetearchaeota archaeon]
MIKDPVHGYIHITEAEKDLIDSLPLQRLRRIKQLVFADLVYPGANHTRFEHSVGVMHLAGLLGKALSTEMTEDDVQRMRIAGLCHDLGHGPFSHTFEQILIRKLNKTHEDLTPWIVRETELKEILSRHGYSADEIADLAVGRDNNARAFMNQIISSAVDVDKMDFLSRDTHHTGAEYGKIDIYRLIYTMGVIEDTLVVDSSALAALEAFLIARVESFRAIYYHKTARAAQILLVRALEAAEEELGLCGFKVADEYLELDDYSVWSELKRCDKSSQIIRDLECRRLLKCAYERELQAEDKSISGLFSLDGIRREVESEIAEIAGIPPSSVFIDTPSLPSIPYFHKLSLDPMEIPIADSSGKNLLKATKISRIIEVLKGFMNIVRVYTPEGNREKVKEASEKILGKVPDSAKVSY